ncbi:pyridoxal 5'-phosphate synthase glutaminase subunit PdxT [Fusibacter sp. JL216-2]|uniref:pyridoxal 5'-phosphate synthase glutaminase subunit PdxT n=1 Tax=Fusibacter sp. JL216-2 TaxID=3071453 RepID=UPI003D32DF03
MKKIGVLALQGAFIEHVDMIKKLGHEAIQVRKSEQLDHINGLIIPGGESTTMGKLLKDFSIKEPLIEKIKEGLPVWGTCAGLILLADTIENDESVHLGQMEITAVRNAYGRQLGSFEYSGNIKGISANFPMVFIRAPYIGAVSENVDVIATVNDHIVAAKQDNMLVTAFHPELTNDTRMHEYFLKMIK